LAPERTDRFVTHTIELLDQRHDRFTKPLHILVGGQTTNILRSAAVLLIPPGPQRWLTE
jgi:hypothetical protein